MADEMFSLELNPLSTTTKRSNAQHLIEYEKQLLYEENQKSGNIMQFLRIPTFVE